MKTAKAVPWLRIVYDKGAGEAKSRLILKNGFKGLFYRNFQPPMQKNVTRTFVRLLTHLAKNLRMMPMNDPTRPPFEYNTMPEDVVRGLLSDTPRHPEDGILISVDELLERVVVGIKVRRESVTTQVLDLMNIRAANHMGLEGVTPSALIAAERTRRDWERHYRKSYVLVSDGRGGVMVCLRGN